GIELLSASLSQSISNSGTISGGTRGFFITNGTVGGNVVNTGNIKNDNTGIVINTGAVVTGDVRNDAGGTISAVNNTAIEVTGGTVGGNLSNGGIIMTASKGINLTASGKVSGDLSNSGTISASKIAINVVAGGTVTGDIKNSGTLSGGSTGISFQSAASSASSIQNSGTIKNEKIGIYLKTASSLSGGITNATGGVISASTADIDIRQSTVNGSITNNGTLSGASTGILFKSGSAATGIQNSGTISGGGHGIAVKNIGSATLTSGISNTSTGAITGVSSAGIYVKSASLTGGITNDGTLSGGDYGVYLLATSSVGGNLANNGTIENVSTGIRVYGGSSITGDLTNSGTISASTGGIVLNNSSIGGTISNSGTINVSGSYGIALNAATATSLQNSGTIENASTGLYVYNVNSFSGGITNTSTGVITSGSDGIKIANSTVNGAITNAAGGTVSGSNTGIHFALTNIINGAVSNSGLIKGGSYGINSSTPGATALKNGITNNAGGTISGGTTAIRLDGTNLYAAVSNSGTITGAKGIALNGTPLFFATPVIVNNAGGTISGTGGTAISINNISDPTPILVNGGSIIGDVTDTYHSLSGSSPVEIAANFTTQGNFTVSNFTVDSGKTLTIGSADTITADQGLTLTGATVNVGVDGTATFGKIVTGVAPDLSSTTITVNVAASPTLTDGDALKIIQGGGNITGGPGDVTPQSVTDNSLLWSFAIVEGNYNALSSDSDLYLVVNAAAGGCGGMTTTSGNNSACTVLQANSGTADPQLSQVIANVNGASTNQQLNNILSSTQPDVNGSGLQQTITVSDDALDINGTQLADLRDGSTGMAAGNGAAGGMNGLRGWLQTFGQASHQNARGGIAGYDGHTLGLAAGIDSGHNLDGKVVGFAFSYGHTMVGSDNANSTDTDIDSYQLSTYGSYDLPENSYVQGMAALAWNNLDTTRHNVGGGGGPTAKGSFSSRLFSLRGEYGRDFAFKGATVTPKLTGHWTFYNADSYTETGAGGADLHVHYKNYNILEIGPAIAARWKHKYADGSELVPQLSMAYRYDLIGDNIEASSSFTGGTGTVASVGPNPARGRLSLGAKATLLTADNWSLTADYDFDYKTDYTSHAGYLRAGYQF
ncbi:MAG: autotransporter domain-containing protein, partial [Alphaproteobacteria bacterium]|nr:autotransporter domain-containing protein [Alphaproteobacteria bacterium]